MAKKPQLPDVELDPVKAMAELCRRDLAEFVREFWDEIVGEPLEWSPHMDVICAEVQAVFQRIFMRYAVDVDGEPYPIGRQDKLYDLVINVPPGTSKSTLVSQMAPAWGWANDPTLRIIGASYNEDLAMGHAVKHRDLVQSEKYRLYFPEVMLRPDVMAKSDFQNTRLGQRKTASVGGGITGNHAHIIIIDDPINTQQAASKADMKAANTWIDTTLPTRKVSKTGTPTITIMQRLASDDPTQAQLDKIKKGLKVRHVKLPAILNPRGTNVEPKAYAAIYQPVTFTPAQRLLLLGTDAAHHAAQVYVLDQNRLGVVAMAELKIKLGSAGFAGQLQQEPAPSGGLIWQKWLIEVPDENFPDFSVLQQSGTDWDLAYTKEDINAASAYISGGVIGANIYIDALGWDWLEFPDLIKWMKTKAAPHYIEAKASGKSSQQVLVKQKVVAIEVPVKGGADKVARARAATPVAEAGMVYIRKSLADRLYNDENQGILFFPNGKGADLADVLAQFIQRLSNGGTLVVAGNTTQDANGQDLTDLDDYELDAIYGR